MRRAAVVLLVVLTTVGCVQDQGVRAVPGEQGSTVLVNPPSDSSGEAIVAGTLVLTEGGCLGLRIGTEVDLAVWPSGTTPLTDAVGVDAPRLGSLAVGDRVHTGGGYGAPERLDEVAGLPRACLTAEIAYPSGY